MIYSVGDLESIYFLGIIDGRKTIEIVNEISYNRHLYLNPKYKYNSLPERYLCRRGKELQ